MAVSGKKVALAVLAIAGGVTLLFIGLTLANLDQIRTSVAVRRSARPILHTPAGTMVIVPEGEFQVPAWEKPPKLPAFYIDQDPVSREILERFLRETGRNGAALTPEDEQAFCEWAGKRLPTADELAKAGRGATPENDVSIYGVRGMARGGGLRCALDEREAGKFR
ncbi:MAG: SUMF1/EgtB/PvdO family nonheme iron enzyme [Bryobacteraceae bacterium]